jgi:predicted GH43/DUF377 family glycosyl hydrolase
VDERVIKRISETLLLRPQEVKPFSDDFTVIGVFNPGAVRVNDEIVLLARVAEQPREHRPGFIGLPRWEPNGKVVVDWASEDELDRADPRVVRRKSDNLLRLTSISHLRVFRNPDGDLMEWMPGSVLLPVSPMEEFGMEDARIVEIDGTYWITYVTVSRHGVATALASTHDFVTFERHGVVFYPENKDVVLFPQKVNGEYLALHRPNPNSHFGRPEIWVARSKNLLHWGQHECLLRGNAEWESDRVGAGTPPVLLEEGWLELYHGSRRAERAGEVGAYSVGALLLDRDNPARILRRSHKPIMQPTADFERSGFVDNVVFPTAMTKQGDTLSVYYGAADTYTGVVEFSQRELLSALH